MMRWRRVPCCRKKTKKKRSSQIWRLHSERGAPATAGAPTFIPAKFLAPHQGCKDVRILGLMKNMRRILAVLLVLSAPLVFFSFAQTFVKAAASSRFFPFV